MKAVRKPETIAAGLSVPERVLLFCIASGTDWQKAGVTGETVMVMVVKELVDRDAAQGADLVPMQIEAPTISGWKPRGKCPRSNPTNVADLNRRYHQND
jgi:hypothetical protein